MEAFLSWLLEKPVFSVAICWLSFFIQMSLSGSWLRCVILYGKPGSFVLRCETLGLILKTFRFSWLSLTLLQARSWVGGSVALLLLGGDRSPSFPFSLYGCEGVGVGVGHILFCVA